MTHNSTTPSETNYRGTPERARDAAQDYATDARASVELGSQHKTISQVNNLNLTAAKQERASG